MGDWLPPRAPGANPPPRFDAAPEPEPEPEEKPTHAFLAPLPGGVREPGTRSGWAPPHEARRDDARGGAREELRDDARGGARGAPRDDTRGGGSRGGAGEAAHDPLWGPPREAPRTAGAGPASPPRAAGATSAAARPNPAAVWALVLGITGLVLLLLSFGTLFLLTLPCSAAAWVLARRAGARIERGETTNGGGQATAALWLGRIGVLVGVAALVAFIALTATGFDFEAFRDDLERDLQRRRDGAR